MRKFVVLALVIVLALSLLTACGRNGDNNLGGNSNTLPTLETPTQPQLENNNPTISGVDSKANPTSDFKYRTTYDSTTDYTGIMIQGYVGNGTNVVIPEIIDDLSVTVIEAGALQNLSSLKSVTIPNSVTRINGKTFANCTSLTSVAIPDSVEAISDGAFIGCTSLSDDTKQRILQINPHTVFDSEQGGNNTPSDGKLGNSTDASPADVIKEGIWPDNEFTQQIPEPPILPVETNIKDNVFEVKIWNMSDKDAEAYIALVNDSVDWDSDSHHYSYDAGKGVNGINKEGYIIDIYKDYRSLNITIEEYIPIITPR